MRPSRSGSWRLPSSLFVAVVVASCAAFFGAAAAAFAPLDDRSGLARMPSFGALPSFSGVDRSSRAGTGIIGGVGRGTRSRSSRSSSASTTTSLSMVFDFFKQRAAEGIDQAKNLGESFAKGKLGEGLIDAAAYTRTTNEAFASGLAKSRNKLLYGLETALSGGGDILEELEDVLLQADLGLSTAEDVMKEVKSLREDSTQIFGRDDIRSILRGKLIEALEVEGDRRIRFEGMTMRTETGTEAESSAGDEMEDEGAEKEKEKSGLPTVLFVMGANGMGKTTTIGKLAARLRIEGSQKVLLAACDTFRAGAVEQLEMWADRAEVDVYSPNEQQKTPAAVLYGSLDKALEGKYDTLIVDTSGRLSNNDALTAELAKMKRVIQKRLSVETDADSKPIPNLSVPHETLLVIDAAQGRMALDSAKQWEKEIGLTGLILTKLDGSARGGSVVAVSRELDLPVKLIGVGEGIDDLRDFDPESFVDGLLGIGDAGGRSGAGASEEGRALAGRLQEMRKARDERAKVRKKQVVAVGAGAAGGGAGGAAAAAAAGAGPGPAGEMTFQEMDAPDAANGGGSGGPSGGATPRKPKNRNKNKKKKKRKGKR